MLGAEGLFSPVSGRTLSSRGSGAIFFGIGVEIDEFQCAAADQPAGRIEFFGTVADHTAGNIRRNEGQRADRALGGFLHNFYIRRAAHNA